MFSFSFAPCIRRRTLVQRKHTGMIPEGFCCVENKFNLLILIESCEVSLVQQSQVSVSSSVCAHAGEGTGDHDKLHSCGCYTL